MSSIRRVRAKRLLILAVLLVTAGGVAFAIHRYQKKRKIDAMLVEARQLRDGGDREAALHKYSQYVYLRPQDSTALAEYVAIAESVIDEARRDNPGKLMNRKSLGTLINLSERLLLQSPDHHEERWKLSKLYFETNNLANARTHLRYLEDVYETKAAADAKKTGTTFTPPYTSKPEYWILLAEIEYLEGRNTTKTIECLKKAVDLPTLADPRVYFDLAQLIYGDGKSFTARAEADHLIKGMVVRFKESPAALKVRGLYHLWQYDQLAIEEGENPNVFNARKNDLRTNARKDLDFAAKSAEAADPVLILRMAELARAESEFDNSRDILSTGLKTFPKNAAIRYAFSQIIGEASPASPAVAGLIGAGAWAAESKLETAKRNRIRDELVTAARDANRQDPILLDVIQRLIDIGEAETAKSLLSRVKDEFKAQSDGSDSPFLGYFQARIAMVDGNWSEALPLLTVAVPQMETKKGFGALAWQAMAECHALAGNTEGQLDAAAKAVKFDPNRAISQFLFGDALNKIGRFGPAVETLKPLVKKFDIPKWRARLCEAMFRDVAAKPEKERDWQEVDDLLGPEPLPAELVIIRSAIHRGKKEPGAAEKVLSDAIKRLPADLSLRLALAELKAAESPAAAANVLADAESAIGDHPDLRIARLGLLLRSPPKPDSAVVEQFGRGADTFTPDGRYRLDLAIGIALTQCGHSDRAIPYFERACTIRPFDLSSRMLLFDAGLAARNEAALGSAVQQMKRLEGEDGPTYVICKSALELGGVKPADSGKLNEMLTKVEAARAKRALWPPAYRVLGEIQAKRGNLDDALSHYLKAIELGDRSRRAVTAAYAILKERGQFERANQLLLTTGLAAGFSKDDVQRVVAYQAATNNPQAALAAIPADSSNYLDQLSRAQLLHIVNQPAPAEAAFRKALDLSQGKAPEVWFGLIRFLVQIGKKDTAQTVLAEAAKTLPKHADDLTSKSVVPLTLGLCSEVLGDAGGAEKYYTEAAKHFPDNVTILRQLSGLYYQTGREKDAELLYRQLIDDKNTTPAIRRFGRRMLATTLTSRPTGFSELTKAVELLDENLKDANQVEDLRAKAFCIAVDPLRRDEAKRMILDSAEKFALTPDDHVMLASIYAQDRQDQQALKSLQEATRDPMPAPAHLGFLVKVQLRLGYSANATATVKQLKALAPLSWEAAAAEARLLANLGDKDAAARRLLELPLAQNPGEIPGRIVPLLEEIGCGEQAEKALIDDLAKAKGPTRHLPLTTYYIRTGQLDKAVATAKAYDKADCPPGLTARLLSAAVYARPRSAADPDGTWAKTVADVYSIVADKDAASPNDVEVLFAKAELADVARRYDDAIVLYERCVTMKPDNLIFLNNTAYFIALHKGKSERPLILAEKVIALRGHRPEFVDTRGLGHLANDDWRKAVADFTLAAKMEPKPVYFFHLARAQAEAGNPNLSNAALSEAEARGLTDMTYMDLLHPLEWDTYKKLKNLK